MEHKLYFDRYYMTHLVSIGMTANDNGFLPAWYQPRNVTANDGLTEHSTS